MQVKKVLTLTWGLPDPSPLLCALHHLGWEAVWVSNASDARQALAQQPIQAGLLLLGPHTGSSTGHGPLSWTHLESAVTSIQRLQPLEWVALCDASALESAALRNLLLESFFDYQQTPPDWAEVARVLDYLYRRSELRRSLQAPSTPAAGEATLGMVGHSAVLAQLRLKLRKVAANHAPVLISGESGSGKELAARAIHDSSDRCAAPFVAVNCAAIAPSLIQSELFGYEKGAFTGATARKQGLIEAAHGGTLFLDEIGDLSLELQANLLRFLQERSIYRVGGLNSVAVDTRVVAATHVQLQHAVSQGRFREDLFYRLNVLPIDVPPLRARREDVVVLAQHFFALCGGHSSTRLHGFAQNALAAMAAYDWPGNVRELYNRVQRAVVMSDSRWISAADLGLSTPEPLVGIGLENARTQAEREIIQSTLTKAGHNITQAARDLGVSRMTLYRLMDKHGIVI
ncbi:sigma-54 interaction domain-containing protein [Comamonas terrigena]|uniref:sigma-54 interaction domain-containing protein n=1 Tax=Comamonas terrigena TaxID=32013 RepID=UPI0028AD31D2|nr:sigma-54 dependent transcriptional regulator [Comamonas terrigena]